MKRPPRRRLENWRERRFHQCFQGELSGRGGEIRTHDLLYPKQARYQATLRPDPRQEKLAGDPPKSNNEFPRFKMQETPPSNPAGRSLQRRLNQDHLMLCLGVTGPTLEHKPTDQAGAQGD